jgi:hypothetical protein
VTGIVRTGFVPLAAIALLYVLIPAAAHAATIYRCAGPDGKSHYVVSPGAPEGCEPMLRYADPRPVAPPLPPSRSAPPVADGKTHAIYRQMIGGIAHYSTTPPQDGPLATVALTYVARCYACDVGSSIDFGRIALDQSSYSAEIDHAAAKENLDPAWLRAVIHAESAFDANALSVKGAQGLMQLMPATAARFGASDAFVPSENIRAGASYLAWLLKRYGGDVTRATAAYNAGERAVDRYGGVPPFEETRRYVQRVAILSSRYRRAE